MITVTIKTASLLSDLRIKSQMNTERIKDAGDRYAVRAAEHNDDEVMEGLQEAWRTLIAVCRRFLAATDDTAGSDTFGTGTTDKTLSFDVTQRRSSNIGDALAQAIHEYLVDGTLRRFYSSAVMPDLVTLYGAAEKAALDAIMNLIYRKMEPAWEDDGSPATDPAQQGG